MITESNIINLKRLVITTLIFSRLQNKQFKIKYFLRIRVRYNKSSLELQVINSVMELEGLVIVQGMILFCILTISLSTGDRKDN